ncbi:MAG: N-acetylneuraminate synthase family protein [Treponemataceae bacterium]
MPFVTEKKPYIIAEIGSSHLGSIQKAQKLIETAAKCGADCVKFQIIYADELLHPNTGFVNLPTGNIRLYDRFKELEVDFSFYKQCKIACDTLQIDFAASPFGIKSFAQLLTLEPALIKIASPELNHTPLLEYIVKNFPRKETPLILSSGVSKIQDIEKALSITKKIKHRALLHCVTSYPAPEIDYNLKILPSLSSIFDINIGISDHTLHPYLIPVLSCAYGSKIIEKHICLEKDGDGLDDPVALNPKDFLTMIKKIHEAILFLPQDIILHLKKEFGSDLIDKIAGNGKKILAPSEKENYNKTNRSIHFMRQMKAGEKITEKDIAVLRTEKVLTCGLHPDFYTTVLNQHLVRDALNGEGLQWCHLLKNL